MKKNVLIVVMAALGLIHCGGAEVSDAQVQAQDGTVSDSQQIAGGVKDAAITGAGGNIAVDAGFASDGTTINIPTGFTASQCKLTAAAATIEGSAISTRVSIDQTTGEVVCEKVVQERTEIPPEVKGCVASYTIICTK